MYTYLPLIARNSDYCLSSIIRQSFFLPKQSQRSRSKMDLDLWDCFGRVKIGIIAKFYRTDVDICSHSIGTKPPSYSRINTVILEISL